MTPSLDRRRFLSSAGRTLGGALLGSSLGGLALGACSRTDAERYTEADIAALEFHFRRDAEESGRGPYGSQRYRGYRGLAELPWFELDPEGVLRVADESVPKAIDFHCHLGMSVLFEPELDLQARTERVRHLLDCDGTDPGCELDLDIYINGNFTEEGLGTLRSTTITLGLWGNDIVRSQTIPNLLDEMDSMRVEKSVILPIVLGLPFGDDLETHWRTEIERAGASDRLLAGTSVHPRDPDKIEQLEAAAALGARVLKLHPTVQAFYPDERDAMEIYEAAERLGFVVFFHGGRAGIEPTSHHPYAMPRHYEGALSSFPKLPFVLGHAGARDGPAMLDLGLRYENAWFGIHGQSVSHLDEMIRRSDGERLLFGTDWPFYHSAATLEKVLIVTQDPTRGEIRHAILRGNAERLLS
jgi:hypothetical protein